MDEEEKKAIDKLQYTIEINQNILDGIEIDEQVIKSMETTLNLIDKQQKEIEKRLKEIDSLYKMMSTKDDEIKYLEQKLEQYGLDYQILKDDIEEHRIAYVDTPEFEEKYISKDKIKDIIFEFIPKSIHEVELRTKIIKLLGETND